MLSLPLKLSPCSAPCLAGPILAASLSAASQESSLGLLLSCKPGKSSMLFSVPPTCAKPGVVILPRAMFILREPVQKRLKMTDYSATMLASLHSG